MTFTDAHWPRASDWLARGDADPQLVVVGVPTSVGSISPSRAFETPPAVREALRRLSTFDGDRSIDVEDLRVADLGDWAVARLDVDEVIATVRAGVSGLPTGPVHVFLGGDNLITYPIVAGLPHATLARTGLLTFDAHHDVRSTEDGITNGAPVRLLLDEGLSGEHVVQVGIHSFANSGYYRRWAEDRMIRVETMAAVEERGIATVVTEALERLAATCDVIHVDVDIDVLDRAFAPGCPGARPGGMTPRQLGTAAYLAGRHPKVVSADLVEVDAAADADGLTVMTTASTLLAFAAGVASR